MAREDERVGDSRKYVFVGDTGDRDEDAAERMAKAFPHKLRAVFLHTVYPVDVDGSAAVPKLRRKPSRQAAPACPVSALTPLPSEQKSVSHADRTINGVPIYYFRTYIGAAVKAYEANLLDLAAVKRVAAQATADMRQHENHARERLNTAQQKQLVGERGNVPQRRWWAVWKPRSVRTASASGVDVVFHPPPSTPATQAAVAVTNWDDVAADKRRVLDANLRSKWVDLCEDAKKLHPLLGLVKRPLMNNKSAK
jgi:hypothetical protein